MRSKKFAPPDSPPQLAFPPPPKRTAREEALRRMHKRSTARLPIASERAEIEARKNKRVLKNTENPPRSTAAARLQYGRGQRTKKARIIDLTEGVSAYQESQETQDLEAAFEEARVAGKLLPPGVSQANPIDL
ncbi:hypothetical protein FN846DRAFT_893276 [Sphaerosporella brunnea]|uniref:Ribosome biogenesis protein SLX9 n=1 Tax=Sphaerosporella brunnea TaxID=1250544 RepID=A0A5J5ELV4_9PEZI|nr:hypothetical protein FN846DRAFT_893276 [Sphaerosporella brunnea]